MPRRRPGVSGFVPLPGWNPENDWQGFEDPADLPASFNPDCGYLVTCNQNLNHLGRAKPINVGMGPYRSDRIGRLLSEDNKITCETMFKLHFDIYSTQAAAFMEILGPLLPDTEQGRMLRNWDFKYSADSEAAYLFDRFYKQLYQDVFGDHGFGVGAADHVETHTGLFNDFYINFDRILLSENSLWFGGNTREALFRQAAEKALQAVPQKWGDTRQVMMKNILFDGKLPKFFGFDRGPITIIGSLATPHQGQIFESAGRLTTFAPSFRLVSDMVTDEIYTNMAGGPSDRRFSKWYVSDLENWKTGKYKKISAAPDKARLPFK
jgi:penicillin amidase